MKRFLLSLVFVSLAVTPALAEQATGGGGCQFCSAVP